MECNKDEAVRAVEIAQKKFSVKDFVGAKKFALKAHNLYPELEGLSQMIETLNVYNHAENKINGEPDWYGILGVNPQADDDTVRKHYRKLALMLHPDKNKSIGAEGAFKFISQAWSLLSDKGAKAVYDQKMKGKVFQKGSTSGARGTNGFHNFAKTTHSNSKVNKSSSHKPKSNTFWTVCHQCRMQYEYLRVYLNHNLLCPNCHEPFLAVETAPPSSKASTASAFPHQQHKKNLDHQTAGNSARKNFEWEPFSKSGDAYASHVAKVVQQAYQKVKQERKEAQAALKREEVLRRKRSYRKRKRGTETGSDINGRKPADQMHVENADVGKTNHFPSKRDTFTTGRASYVSKPNDASNVLQFEVYDFLMQKAKTQISKKLEDWNSTTVRIEPVGKGEKSKQTHEKGDQALVKSDACEQDKYVQSVDAENGVYGINLTSPVKVEKKTLQTLLISVPEADFHDFDKDRTERSFEGDQVWAVYDDDDGMPRHYALIHDLISVDPFAVRMSWLRFKSNCELGLLNLVSFSGLRKTCGDFRVGRRIIYKSINSFSHKIRFIKGTCCSIKVYPRRGDVWALYRNWAPDWNELTEDEVMYKYDMVEVLEGYDREQGVIIAPLVKVIGFKTIFRRHLDRDKVRRIPNEEMFQFSHLVPWYLLTGKEADNALKGCLELDPAATPLELLQVIREVKEEGVENGGKTEGVYFANNKTCITNSIGSPF